MTNSNLQQWWEERMYRHQLMQTFNPPGIFDFQSYQPNFKVGVAAIKQHFGNNNYEFYLNHTFTISAYDPNVDEENFISSLTLLIMAISFGLVTFGGFLGNATLLFTLFWNSSLRLRNPLLLAVCIADLLVTGISAPTTFFNIAFNRNTHRLPQLLCQIIHYVQVMPVAASTISFFMLSLDRYATVTHPGLAQLRQRRYLHVSLALFSWIISAAVSTPFLFTYQIMAKVTTTKNESSEHHLSSTLEHLPSPNENNNLEENVYTTTMSPRLKISCISVFDVSTIYVSFIIIHTFAVFIIPGLGVLLNHYGVRQKLCALSLTARAAHGELPLPVPILRRQTHMVIVTGIANAQQAADCGTTDDISNEPDIQMQHLNRSSLIGRGKECIKSSNPISPRAMREIRAYSQRQRISNNLKSRGPAAPGIPLPQTSTLHSRRRLANMLIASALIFIFCWVPHVFCVFYTNFGYKYYCSKTSNYFHLLLAMREIRAYSQRQRISNNLKSRGPAAPGIPLPQTSTLHSRRRLANMLIASALIFIFCWVPHVFCVFYTNFGYKYYCSKTSNYFHLLLGYFHSAISPIIYWILNHNTLRQSPCAPIIRLRSMQNFLRTRFRSNAVPPPPSSTNEAALGAFNPKLIKLTPKQYRAQASSHYLY